MTKPFEVPLSPDQLQQQRLVGVIELSPLPSGLRVITDFRELPSRHTGRSSPAESRFLAALEWAWGPMNNRLEGFYLERHADGDWVLWSYLVDLEENGDPPWVVSAVCPHADLDERSAAIHLLTAALSEGIETQGLDHFHWIANTGLLRVDELRAIGRRVWPNQRQTETRRTTPPKPSRRIDMAIITREGPLPDNHPLKGGLIIFGDPRPKRKPTPEAPANQKGAGSTGDGGGREPADRTSAKGTDPD